MYAIVKVGGKQYRVEKGDSLVVDRLSAKEGDKLDLEPLLFRPDGDRDPVFAGAELEKVKVEAVVRGHERGRKIHVLKFKPKRGYKRRTGHRSELTRLDIGEIKLLSRRPAGAARAKPAASAPEQEPAAESKPKAPAKKAGTARSDAAKAAPKRGTADKPKAKTPAKRAGTTRTAGKASTAKKPAARKPAAKKKKESDDGS
jgi:large subunit ribosomal protein L21